MLIREIYFFNQIFCLFKIKIGKKKTMYSDNNNKYTTRTATNRQKTILSNYYI